MSCQLVEPLYPIYLTCAELEKDKNELHVKLLQTDKERRIAIQKETDLAKRVCCSLHTVYTLQYTTYRSHWRL